jgi:hypothetical protein
VASDQTDHAKLNELVEELTAAYWGQTVFAEDKEVAVALHDFYFAVRDYQNGLAGTRTPDRKVKLAADRLAETCKASISHDAPPGIAQP